MKIMRVLCGASIVVVMAGCASSSTQAGIKATSKSTTTVAKADGSLDVVKNGLDAATAGKLNAAANKAYRATSAPGAVMAIKTSEGTWLATIGYQDWSKKTPMTANVNQRVGSVTKTFTGTVLLQLAEKNQLSMDDPIDKYVPGMPNGSATLAQLAEMRSGIPSYTFDDEFQKALFSDPERQWKPAELVELVEGDEPMFEPGSMMFYSNTNLVLLGMVIEKVTGKSVEEVMKKQIFEPLGMTHTEFPTDATYPKPHPHGYTLQGSDDNKPVDATDWNPSWAFTAGAMISNVDDLLTWGKALGTGEHILSPEMQKLRLSSFDFDVPVYTGPDQSVSQTPDRAYGLALGLANEWYGHEGELPGFNTYVHYYEPDGITLVVMANSDISSGSDCGDTPTAATNPEVGPCMSPASRIGNALGAALGHPFVSTDSGQATSTTTD